MWGDLENRDASRTKILATSRGDQAADVGDGCRGEESLADADWDTILHEWIAEASRQCGVRVLRISAQFAEELTWKLALHGEKETRDFLRQELEKNEPPKGPEVRG